MNKSDSIKNLAAALSKFQSEVKNPRNTEENPFYKAKYAPLHEVLNDTRPLLTKHGLSVIQSPGGDGKNITITTMIIHESGEWIELEPLALTAEKATPQGAGSAITYGRRYALSALLGISSEDDDDGNAMENRDNNNSQPQNILASIKSKYQAGNGSLDGFDEWYKKQKEKGFTEPQMNAYLAKSLKQKQKGA